MSVALPFFYVSPPAHQNVGWSNGTQVRVKCLTGVSAYINGWRIAGNAFSGGHFNVIITEPDGITTHLVEDFDDLSGTIPWSQWYTFAETGSGFRLGRLYRLMSTAGVPAYGQKDREEHQTCFADAGSQIVQTFGAYTHTRTFPDPPALYGPVIGVLEWHSESTVPQPLVDYPLVGWQGMACTSWDSATLTQLDDGIVKGTGAGLAEMYAGFGDDAKWIAPAYIFEYDGVVDKNGTPADDWAHLLDTFYCAGPSGALPYITLPNKNGSVTAQNVSWPLSQHVFAILSPAAISNGQYLGFTVQSDWAASQDPALQEADKHVGIRGHCGLDDCDDPTNYQPVSLKVLASVDVHRPDGGKPSSWATLNAGLGTVVDGATNVVFTVTGGGASFRRTVASAWRARADYRDVLHHAAEDVFWVAVYGWLRMTWNGSGSTAAILTVRGVHYDTQTNTEHPFTLNYPVTIASGTHDLFTDLIAGSGAESYPTRVDDWTLTFDTPGTYTLSAMLLVARTDLASPAGKVYFKTLPTQPTAGADYTMLVAALDGAASLGALPPYPASKGHEVIAEDYGGSPRHITADMLTLKDAWLAAGPEYGLGKIEGVEDPIYSQVISDGKNKDAYGVTYGPEQADWLEGNAPHDLVLVGVYWAPYVSPLCARLWITNCVTNKMRARWSLWGAAEGVALSGAGRNAGATIQAVRTDNGAVIATGTTDLMGYVAVTPVPANGIRQYDLKVA